MAKKYHLITIGCAMNQSDGERLASRLNELGWRRVNNHCQADLVILVTCGVRQSAEDRIYGLINQVKKDNPGAAIAITGCLVYRQDIKAKLKNKVNYWFSINDLKGLEQILASNYLGSTQSGQNYLDIIPDYQSKISAFVPIGNGCNNFCSYCVVPYARGREIYRPAEDIIIEIQQLLNKGYQEITIIAQNVNSYKDQVSGLDFTGLLEKLDNLGDYWLRFATSHPKDMSDRLINFLGHSHNLIHHLHLPVQSGSNKILTTMNRGYTIEHYRELIDKVRRQWPDVVLTTDIIVGFPGESNRDFEDTIKVVKDLKFDQVYSARYSPRPGTVAATMIDDVPANIKKEREQKLDKIVKAGSLQNRKKQVGQKVTVLLEEKRGNCYFGHTDHGLQILITSPKNENYNLGSRYPVQITNARSFSLAGRFL
ncbi:MAG TPA: tRNA (N6-isopentenyl adenosine(37)-C2)-methylthiotransferase MiaB [bacterium]|jgi:tRNA-2-methylthio-N6-dimethylallyladenosine synthase|nr:tRNA (N6-isopentenyl adenosine(37)-C2)-methylthiotransferase MiaB [bacterium]HPU92377.1 tRNA (N6-isopentenyl adenosine(37)-C2)-methylthiotransferase MiaB [bacterium]HPX64582.1 tRNA (N6-isopentenyl adenosine(37)-C2)-methylthiotransferase MiaB [bacterium]HQB26325.1 tRNA (N6-isopentenyl adenosine(37)-C2)-methylthiotransferase MiaB [bacterium]